MEWIVYVNVILKSSKNGVKVKFLSEEELPIFRSFMEDTTETRKNSKIEMIVSIIIAIDISKIACLYH